MNDQSKIKARIAALLAKAQGTNNEHEAEAFMAKALEMLEQHQLSLNDVLGQDDPVIHDRSFEQAASSHKWNRELYRALGRLYGCDSCLVGDFKMNPDGTIARDERGRYRRIYRQELVGRESAIVTTQLMYPWICEQVRSKAKDIAKVTGMSEQGQAKRVAAALLTRIWILINEQERKQRQSQSTMPAVVKNALITLDLVKTKAKEAWGETVTMKSRSTVSDGLSRHAANSIGLNRQAGGAGQLRIGSR